MWLICSVLISWGFQPFIPIFKNIWQYAHVLKLYKFVPLFRNLILLKSSYAQSNIKKKIKKIAQNSSSIPIVAFRKTYSGVFMQFFFTSLIYTRFRELYSGVLKPYSGIFMQFFFFLINLIYQDQGTLQRCFKALQCRFKDLQWCFGTRVP